MKYFNNFFDFISEVTSTKRKYPPFWIYEFDETSYVKDFNWKSIKLNFIIILTFLLFSNYILNEILASSISFIYHNLDNNPITNIIIYYFFPIFTIVFAVLKVSKGYLPTLESIIIFIAYYLIFFIYIKLNDSFSFLPLENDLKFTDVVFISCSILLSKWSLYFKRKNTSTKNYQFITDNKNSKDLFGYAGLTKELNEFIHHTESPHSFAIAILGNWGDGKSFFSTIILNHFDQFNDDYIILEFNPWLHKRENLVESFFDDFTQIAATIDMSIVPNIKLYSKKLANINDQLSIIETLTNIIADDKSVDELRTIISNKIKLSRKKVLVFLDDTDRLDKEEIHEVLKIIRNSADFSNTYFLVGIDYDYINSKTDNPKYLEKIFNVLISLPKVTDSIIKNLIISSFNEHFPDDKDLQNSLSTLLNFKWFAKYLTNLRQLNRLINSIKIPYNKLKQNIDYQDLLILQLLKNCNTKLYNDIYNNKVINLDLLMGIAAGNNGWEINQEYEKTLDNDSDTKYLLNYLIKREEDTKSMRAFSNGYNLLYYNYSIEGFNIIEYYKILNENIENIVLNFNDWINNNETSRGELLNLLTQETRLLEERIKFIPILLQINDDNFSSRIFQDVFIKYLDNLNNAHEVENYIEEILKLILNNYTFNAIAALNWTSSIAIYILRKYKNPEMSSNLPSDIKILILKIYKLTLTAILQKDNLFIDKYKSFQLGVIELVKNRFTYEDEYIYIFKNYIIENKQNFIDFIKASVLGYWNGNYDEHSREVMIIDYVYVIFNNKMELLTELKKVKDSLINPLIDFLLAYLDEYYSFKREGNSNFNKYINDKDLHKKLLEYFNNNI